MAGMILIPVLQPSAGYDWLLVLVAGSLAVAAGILWSTWRSSSRWM